MEGEKSNDASNPKSSTQQDISVNSEGLVTSYKRNRDNYENADTRETKHVKMDDISDESSVSESQYTRSPLDFCSRSTTKRKL